MSRHFRRLTAIPRAARMRGGLGCPNDTDSDGCTREYGDSNTSCGEYNDAMVCTGQYGGAEVTCSGETFRGCYYGQQDIDSGTDYCCSGSTMPGAVNDNIDHGGCQSGYDAGWGETCIVFDDQDGCPWWNDCCS